MPALLLTEKEVEGLLQMDDALVAVEEGLRAMGRGEATNAHGSESEPERPRST